MISQYKIRGNNSHLLSQNVFDQKHNLPVKENNSLEQAAFSHEVKVVIAHWTGPFFTLCKHD